MRYLVFMSVSVVFNVATAVGMMSAESSFGGIVWFVLWSVTCRMIYDGLAPIFGSEKLQ